MKYLFIEYSDINYDLESLSNIPLGGTQSVIINLTENGGGTGHFDSVWKIRRKFEWSEKTGKFEDRIHLISLYSGGDRCNGGVYDVHVGRDEKGEYINISSQITAFMFLEQKKPSYNLI